MDTVNTPPEQIAETRENRARFGPLILALQTSALVAAALLATAAVAVLVPDDGDYAKASVLKHGLLAEDVPRKIVLVGGSNLSYGTDSLVIQEQTGCPVVNMGMNGYFGVRFMMEEVKPYLQAGDIVVIAWEYDSFYKSVDGTNTDLLMVTKANPRTFSALTLEQKLSVISRYPYVAQQKTIRLVGEAYESLGALISPEEPSEETIDILSVEGYSSFSPRGDLVGHLDLTWTGPIESGDDISNLPMDQEILPLMQDFIREMEQKDVRVMVSWTPIIEDFYEQHKDEIERLNAQMDATPGFLIPRPARDFVFPQSQHFDTAYHLNAEGRAIRSRMVADDIKSQFGDDALCDRQP